MTNSNSQPTFTSIENFTEVTGKRFRMLKEQKARGLTREQAFAEIYLSGTQTSTNDNNEETTDSDPVS